MSADDVYEVQRLYPHLKPADRKAALNGLALLACAARELGAAEGA